MCQKRPHGQNCKLHLEADAEYDFDDKAEAENVVCPRIPAYDQGSRNQRPSSGKSYGAQRERDSDSQDNNRTREGEHESLDSSGATAGEPVDPWAKAREKLKG